MTEQQLQRLEFLERVLAQLCKSDRYTFEKNIQILDGRNIQVGNTGTIIATETTQKLGFFGHTPTALQTGVAVSAAGVHAALTALGFITP